MRIFKSKWFERFAHREDIGDAALCEAVERADRGLIDANLGGGLIKQRVARAGQGRSGGYRSIIAFRTDQRAFFVFGFAKSERGNLGPAEFVTFKKAAGFVLSLNDSEIAVQIALGEQTEVFCNGQDLQE